MCYALALYGRLHAQMATAGDSLDRLTRGLFAAYLIIMVLFVVCFALLAGLHLLGPDLYAAMAYRLFCGAAFLLGSAFVLVGTAADLRLSRVIHQTNLALIRTLVNAVEARDPNLRGHSEHVAALVMLLYRNLPAAVRRRHPPRQVEYAALLHDIGKIGIAEDILNKPGPLTEEEFAAMRAHPLIGRAILEPIPGFEAVCEWICYHHERVDGGGYYGLTGPQIPLVSKLIATADTYSAIVMCRSYKARRTHQEAMDIMARCAGGQLDRGVFRLFCALERKVQGLHAMAEAIPCAAPEEKPPDVH